MSIQEYYSSFQNLWAEFSNIVIATVSIGSLTAVLEVHEVSKRDQFFMKLRSEFENVCSNLMSCDPTPALDTCFAELLLEEQHLLGQVTIEQATLPAPQVAFTVKGRDSSRSMSKVQCFNCKNYGHIAANCTKKFCNYCKKSGHIIKECSTHLPKRHPTAFQANKVNSVAGQHANVVTTPPAYAQTPAPPVLTPEMMQQMIISAFSILGIQGITRDFKNVLVSPELSHNLLSVGQLVDDDLMSIFLVMDVLCKIQCRGQ